LLCAFDRQEQQAEGQVVTFEDDLPELLKSIYPELSLTELALLFKKAGDLFSEVTKTDVLKTYGLKANQDLNSVLEILPRTPNEFQDFVHHKKLAARELSPLRAVFNLAEIKDLLISIALSTLSKSQAVSLLEMAIELYLVDRSLTKLLKNDNESSHTWLARISALRMPLTKKSDQDFALKTSALNWPSHVKAEWIRSGDQSGLQISLFATSQADFKKKLLGINKINDELTMTPEKLWTNS